MNEQTGEMRQHIKEFWDRRGAMDSEAEPVLKLRNEQERQVWLETLRGLLPTPPADLVDLGTGTGFLALLFADLGHRSTGVDLSDGMLAAARSRISTATQSPEFVIGDAAEPPLAPSSWDVVANRNMLWSLLEPTKAFRNWWKLLRPGGRVLVIHGVATGTDPRTGRDSIGFKQAYTDEVFEKLPGMRNTPTVEPAVKLAEATGFVDIEVARLEAIERFEVEHGREWTWLAMTAVRPA